MRKKVMIMLLAATMMGSSVPAGVMAADVTDFAGETVGAEENETEILENTITPIPTETPVPEETTVPEPTETPIPTIIPGEGRRIRKKQEYRNLQRLHQKTLMMVRRKVSPVPVKLEFRNMILLKSL